MGSTVTGGLETCLVSGDSRTTARQVFERAAAEFVAGPQRRWNLECLALAAIALHDEGLAELERRYGSKPGSFGGRMPPDDMARHASTEASKRFASAARSATVAPG